jgi:hypothetical protein
VAHDAHHALAFLVRSGIIDHLDQAPQAIESLAATFSLRADALATVFELMVHFGVVERCAAGIRLGEEGKALRASERNQARYALLMASYMSKAGLHLAETLRTGKPGVDIEYGEPYVEYARRDEEASRNLAALGRAVLDTCDLRSDLVDLIAQRGHRSVADLSGGRAELLCAILAKDPACQTILFDRPDVIAGERQRLRDFPRLTFAEGDIHTSVPAAEAHILANVLFNCGDAEVLAILRAVRAAKAAQESLYILDYFNDGSFESAFLNLDELVITGGACRTLDEMGQILERGGFTIDQTLAGSTPFRLLICVAHPQPDAEVCASSAR